MRRRILFKQISTGLVLVLGVSLLSACQSKTVEYGVDEVTESASTASGRNNAKKGVEQFADAPKWQDEWKTTDAEGEVVTISVDANVTYPDVDEMYVVEVEETVFDEAYKERIAKKIFGDETIYYNDLLHYTKEELKEDKAYGRANYIMNYDEEIASRFESLYDYVDSLVEEAGDTYTPVITYDVDEYRGEWNGILYELSFRDYTNHSSGETINQSIALVPADESEVFPDKFANVNVDSNAEYVGYSADGEGGYSKGAGLENQCTLSEEEAKVKAEEFVKDLGLEYPVCSGVMPLLWEYEKDSLDENGAVEVDENYQAVILESDMVLDGYVIYFDMGIDELSFVAFGTQMDYLNHLQKSETEEKYYNLESRLRVYVTDKGIIEMSADNPLELTGVSNGVEMLPIANVQEIMENQILNEYESFRFYSDANRNDPETIGFNNMDLIYFRVRDKEHEGCYSYVPTWRLGKRSKNESGAKNPVLVNAIDGSVIDLYDEV